MRERGLYFLGIDGGGTKTEFLLVDEEGAVINRLISEGCNPMDVGIDRCIAILKLGIEQTCKDISLDTVNVFAGVAGGSSGDMKSRIYQFLSGMGFHRFQNDSDSLNIIAAGLDDTPGIAMIMGTGICAFVQSDFGLSRVAGWGFFFDNGGSAFNIGRDGINAYYCALDGSGDPTMLTELFSTRIKEMRASEVSKNNSIVEDHQYLLAELYEGGKKLIASFAPMVFSAADEGDAVSASIIERNMQQAAHIIEAAGKKFPESMAEIPVVIAGGLTKQERLLDYIANYLNNPKRYLLTSLNTQPVVGAINLAKRL